jgi:hypothetical protein
VIGTGKAFGDGVGSCSSDLGGFVTRVTFVGTVMATWAVLRRLCWCLSGGASRGGSKSKKTDSRTDTSKAQIATIHGLLLSQKSEALFFECTENNSA